MITLQNFINDTVLGMLFRARLQFEELLSKSIEGQDMVEYALLAGFVALAAGATLDPIGDSAERIFEHVRSVLIRARRA